tara:strand:- start:33 stop:194 length:162 start_codon:yes stop_codon:yes gene_type:complete
MNVGELIRGLQHHGGGLVVTVNGKKVQSIKLSEGKLEISTLADQPTPKKKVAK